MKKHRFLIFMIIICAISFGLFAPSINQSKTEEKVLRVGVKTDIPEFGYYDERSDSYSGLEVDLAMMIAERLGYTKVEFTGVDIDTRQRLLDEGQLDLVLATFTITPERQRVLDFSDAYYVDFTRIMVENSSLIEDPKDLSGITIGVRNGSSAPKPIVQFMMKLGYIPTKDLQYFNVKTFRSGVNFKEYETYDQLIDALESGEVDAASADGCILNAYLTEDRHLLGTKLGSQPYGIAAKKGSDLMPKVNPLILEWKSNGELVNLYKKWNVY